MSPETLIDEFMIMRNIGYFGFISNVIQKNSKSRTKDGSVFGFACGSSQQQSFTKHTKIQNNTRKKHTQYYYIYALVSVY